MSATDVGTKSCFDWSVKLIEIAPTRLRMFNLAQTDTGVTKPTSTYVL